MKTRFLRFLICLFLISFLCSAQNIKAQTDPKLLFAKGIGNEYFGGGDLTIENIKIDASGNRYVTGYFNGTVDLDPSASTANLTSAGNYDFFIAK